MQTYNYKKGVPPLMLCLLLWGFQPLYWYICPPHIDTLLLMTLRIVWAAVFCVIILAFQGKLSQLADVFKDRKKLSREIPASFFLAVDWFVYLFAVKNGKVQQCSLGYYIMPLVQFLFGALIFREKFHKLYFVMLGLIIVGIILSVNGFGEIPYVTIILSLSFAVYAAIKKTLDIDSIVSTTAEILIMVPFALVYIIFFSNIKTAVSGIKVTDYLLLIGSGIVTAVPMLLYAISVKNLPMMMCGLFEYFSPTFSLVCSRIMGESFNRDKLLSFLFIWAGVALYIVFLLRNKNRKTRSGESE